MILVAGLALRAEAAVVAPSKPSEVITLAGDTSTSASCPSGAVIGKMIDKQHNPDGTITTFTVPAGQVFVATSWDWSGTGAASSSIVTGLVLIDSTATLLGTFSQSSASSDSSGLAGGTVVVPSGFVIKSGVSMCYAGGGTRSVVVHGFFTKDK
jgi:hypothetical protein